jgi:hypothetical protein
MVTNSTVNLQRSRLEKWHMSGLGSKSSPNELSVFQKYSIWLRGIIELRGIYPPTLHVQDVGEM